MERSPAGSEPGRGGRTGPAGGGPARAHSSGPPAAVGLWFLSLCLSVVRLPCGCERAGARAPDGDGKRGGGGPLFMTVACRALRLACEFQGRLAIVRCPLISGSASLLVKVDTSA
ncbi:unnamed protein product [Amoebophrya sp. A120]|nr:unnamed protein product [Amoebophrya sp. A120]|eukprot:GSA120T00018296001.1